MASVLDQTAPKQAPDENWQEFRNRSRKDYGVDPGIGTGFTDFASTFKPRLGAQLAIPASDASNLNRNAANTAARTALMQNPKALLGWANSGGNQSLFGAVQDIKPPQNLLTTTDTGLDLGPSPLGFSLGTSIGGGVGQSLWDSIGTAGRKFGLSLGKPNPFQLQLGTPY